MMLRSFNSFPSISSLVAILLKESRYEPMKARRLTNSLDLLTVILNHTDLTVVKKFQDLGITAELARGKTDASFFELDPIVGKSFVYKFLSGHFFKGASPYSQDFRNALQKAYERCLSGEKKSVDVDDLVWGILESNHVILQPLLSSVGKDANELRNLVLER